MRQENVPNGNEVAIASLQMELPVFLSVTS
jgi:hypothetical protein